MIDNCTLTNLSKRELTNTIRSLNFAIVDLSEYLDTHPCCNKALSLHNKYSKQLREAEDVYEKNFGSLTIFTPVDNWDWVCNSWPWERGNC